MAAGDVGVHERHVDVRSPIATSAGRAASVALLDRDALAGQGALLDLQRGGDDHPAVGRHAVAGVDDDDVAGHDLVGGDLEDVAVAPHLGDRLHHRPEGRRRGLGLALLVVSQPGVEQGQQRQSDRRSQGADPQS